MAQCEKCGQEVTSVARDMVGTRNCGHTGGWPATGEPIGIQSKQSMTIEEFCEILSQSVSLNENANVKTLEDQIKYYQELGFHICTKNDPWSESKNPKGAFHVDGQDWEVNEDLFHCPNCGHVWNIPD